jgi:hypothetical protein
LPLAAGVRVSLKSSQFAKHAIAALVSLAIVGTFVLGVDGFLGAMQRFSRLLETQPAPPVNAPADPAVPAGTVPVFVVPATEPASSPTPPSQ